MVPTFPLFRSADRPLRKLLYHWLRDLRQTAEIGDVEHLLARWRSARTRVHPLDAAGLKVIDGRIYAAEHRLRMMRKTP